jgi:ABC-type sulfate/molybdate transport systems ATPase subunit
MVISSGQVIAYDAKHRIFEHPQSVQIAQLTGCKNFFRAALHAANLIEAFSWGITFQVLEAISAQPTDVGIHAHQIRIAKRNATI